LPTRSVRRRFYRIVPRRLQDRILDAEGRRLYGGRYNPKGEFAALYCGETPAIGAAEVRKATRGWALGLLVLATIEVQLHRVLDLTDHTILHALHLRPQDLVAPDWGLTQELGRLAHAARLEGLLVPSGAAPGVNLVLFTDRLDPASALHLVTTEPTEL
jgi:RES domain-containing protein